MSESQRGVTLLSEQNFEALTCTPKSRACVERLNQHKPQAISLSNYPSSKLAAVLVLLYEKAGVLRVLLTTRSRSLRSHPFQTALPGGKHDPQDVDLSATAFREANEEVGLPLGPHLHLLCHLRPFLSQYKLLVTPVVALLTDLSILDKLAPSEAEVDQIFDHPLEAFLDPSLVAHDALSVQGGENWPYTTELYSTSDSPSIVLGTYRMHRFRSTYTPIKGLTADILISTAEIAYNRRAPYERYAPDQIDSISGIVRVIREHETLQTEIPEAALTKNVLTAQVRLETPTL